MTLVITAALIKANPMLQYSSMLYCRNREYVVDRKGAEKESQVEEKFEHFPKLVFDLFSALWMCRIHDSLPPREVADEEGRAMTHAPFCCSTTALRAL